jgi:hypothetical protein
MICSRELTNDTAIAKTKNMEMVGCIGDDMVSLYYALVI